jgi:hypothetical protein
MAKKESIDREQKQHLEWLTDFMSENFKTLEKVQEGLVDKGLVEFKHLPIIFEAGSIVIGQLHVEKETTVKREKAENTERPECFLFHEIGDEQEDKATGAKYMDIEVFRWWYNGSMFGPTAETLRIKEFSGPRKITDLECFPLSYLKEEGKTELIQRLIARGEKWCSYVESKIFQYKGLRRSKQPVTTATNQQLRRCSSSRAVYLVVGNQITPKECIHSKMFSSLQLADKS